MNLPRLMVPAFLIALIGLCLCSYSCRRATTQSSGKRVLILGFDGMDPEILTRLMKEGKMANFQHLKENGDFKPLQTSSPPQSPVAWSNFITGMNPGGHAIFDFIHRDPATMTPYFSTSKTAPPKWVIPIGEWILPLSSGKVSLLRQGRSFWEILKEKGVDATIIRIPSNFPPVKTPAVQLSGMGTPDIQGTYGTFSFYTDESIDKYSGISGGEAYPVQLKQQRFEAKLVGPPNVLKKNSPAATVDFTVFVDAENPVIRIDLQDQKILLQEKQWSDWIRIHFEIIPHFQSVSGICRFYLKEIRPHFKLYVTPMNLDPIAPALPISTPESYSSELSEHIGEFYTQGIPEDTKALSAEILDDGEFLAQARIVFEEELKMFEHELGRFHSGTLFFYFGRVDQLSHMFWRSKDPTHPAHDAAKRFEQVIEDVYGEMDLVLEKALKKVESSTTVIVLSDHGFAPFYRAFNLNSWLKNNAYASLLDFSEGGMLQNVDWNNTRAYGLGFNALYLNLKGREKNGIVQAGAERESLLNELREKLLEVIDPKTGEHVIASAFRPEEIYSGPYVKDAPDLIIGYNKGYRASWETTLGKFPRVLLKDNNEKWSGDHLIEARFVPGILLANKKIKAEHPALYDLAPTILAEFGIAKENGMVGESVF